MTKFINLEESERESKNLFKVVDEILRDFAQERFKESEIRPGGGRSVALHIPHCGEIRVNLGLNLEIYFRSGYLEGVVEDLGKKYEGRLGRKVSLVKCEDSYYDLPAPKEFNENLKRQV